jgi:hypothetical protein
VTRDPETGKTDGLAARIPAGKQPKVFMLESSSEYWDRGRVAALIHTSQDGRQDLRLPENVRFYLLASIPHRLGSFPPTAQPWQEFKGNPLQMRSLARGLLVALDRWVRTGEEPPPSQHPRLADKTLIPQREIRFPNVPGVRWPYKVPGGYRSDLPGPLLSHPLPFLVPQVDRDGNETSGVRFPEQAVPLATYAGWGLWKSGLGPPDDLLMLVGSYLPFARTRAEREKSGDPRLSIEERYTGRSDYLQRVDAATKRLVKERYLLQEDLESIVNRAASHWDWLMRTTTN